MRITKQSSGGRGEYELCDAAPNGNWPKDFIGYKLKLNLSESYSIDTGVIITHAQGKYRLRLRDKSAGYPQVQRQIAAALLLPIPTREESLLSDGEPVLRNNEYLIKNINFGDVELDVNGVVVANVLTVDGANNTVHAKQIPVIQRMQELEMLWTRSTEFPEEIAHLLEKHKQFVLMGNPLPTHMEKLVKSLQGYVAKYCEDLEISYTDREDLLPALLATLPHITTTPPLSLDQIAPDQVELRKREVRKWQQFVMRRGAASVKFRQKVREAYNYRCLICGNRFPSTQLNRTPGVDAAHILPWIEYDLDEVFNGLTLCKLHHWAFDERLLILSFRNNAYYIELHPEAEQYLVEPTFSRTALEVAVGQVPNDRLPINKNNWPNPYLLDRFYEEVP